MDTNAIVAALNAEIARLQQAKSILTGSGTVTAVTTKRSVGRPKKDISAPVVASLKRRTMSAEGRAKIAAAQKARWAKAKKRTP